MNRHKFLLLVTLAVSALFPAPRALAQQSWYQQFRGRNAAMADVQPTWMGPLIQSDSRLSQAVRFSVADANAPGAQSFSYGNGHGLSFIGGRRFQFDLNPPSFFRNHSAALPDGFGNASTQVKYRIVSGNAEHGNFTLTAMLARGFGGGFQQNDMLTGYYVPKLGAGKAFGRFNLQTVVNGVLPTAKVYLQGRVVEWSTTAQAHTTAHTWFDIEDNAAFIFGSSADGQKQNFITPAGFYMIRRQGWEKTHPVFVVDAGEQIATSRFHLYNHNMIAELRMLF